MRYLFLLICLIVCIFSFAYPENYNATGLKGEAVKIDGKLDEEIWKSADVYSGFSCLKTRGGGKPKAETRFSILTDEKNLYIGIRCEEPYMDKLKDEFLPRDSSFWERDSVEIFIDPEGKGINYYQFAVTAGNAQFDSYWIEGGNTQGGDYNSLWESAVYKGDNFWSVEVKIPLYCFYYTDSASFSRTYLINIARNRFPEPELSTWSALERGFHEVRNFRRIGNMPLKNSDYDIKPVRTDVEIKSDNLAGDIMLKIESGKKLEKVEFVVFEEKKEIGRKNVDLNPGSNSIIFENVSFSKSGKRDIVVSANYKGETILGSINKVEINYEKIRVSLNSPFYSNCIYPGQKIKQISGTITLNLPEDKIKNTKIIVEMSGNEFYRKIELKGKKENEFNIEAEGLKEGDYLLVVKLNDSQGEIARKELKIRKLPKPEKGSFVYIDENLNLVVNGEPIFVRGWYGNSTYLVSQAIRNKYGNKPNSQFVNTWECWIGVEAERLHQVTPDELEKLGLNRNELQNIAKEERVRIKQDVKPHPVIFKYLDIRIEKAKENPALWFYYLCDEPECRGISPVYLKYMYEYIKENDPYHPVMIITRSPAQYTECADILNPHPYLNPRVDDSGKRKKLSMRNIKNVVKEVYESGKNRIPAWLTPQAFTYGFIDRFADYPTFDEFNCMVWTGIVNGVKGFTPFIYNDHLNSIDLRLGVDFIYQSLAELNSFLLTHPEDRIKFENTNPEIDVLIKKQDGKILLIAVNMTAQEQITEIIAPELKNISKLYGFRQKGELQIKDGKIGLKFYPYQVHIFTYPEMGKDLKKVEDLKKEINAIRESFKKKGNLLYGKGREIEFNTSDTYISNLSLVSLTDGMTDTYGWASWAKSTTPENPSFVEMKFLTFVPEFKRIKIYSATIEDMDVYIWKRGDWEKIAEVRGNKEDVIDIELKEKIRTVKMKLVIPKVKSGTRAEVYEVELYEN